MMMTTMTRGEDTTRGAMTKGATTKGATTSVATAKEDMVRARITQVIIMVEITGTETVFEGKPLGWYLPRVLT